MLPVLELRGGLIAAALLGVDFFIAFPLCFIGNMIPIPFILLFLRKIFDWMRTRKRLSKIVIWLEKKGQKGGKKVERYKMLGLFIFVAVPLPGTGGWTGALAAHALNIPMKKSLPMITAGVLCAGIIISILAYALPSIFGLS